ncbi:hypothetical protein GB937_010649 [Aspergillus fischeri]|nr:hypothetical protein GB937_010649 [Aspergillus fischeri]
MYLGGTDKDMHELRRVLTQLMSTHSKFNKGYKSKAARMELQEPTRALDIIELAPTTSLCPRCLFQPDLDGWADGDGL